MADILSVLATELQNLLSPLAKSSGSDQARKDIFSGLGWELGALTGFPVDKFISEVGQIAADASALAAFAQNPSFNFDQLSVLVTKIGSLFNAVGDLENLAKDPNVNLPPDAVTALEEIGEALVQLLLFEYLRRFHPLLLQLGRLLTIVQSPVDRNDVSNAIVGADGNTVLRYPAAPPRLQFDRIGKLLSDPVGTLKTYYLGQDGLGTNDGAKKVAGRLFGPLGSLLASIGADVSTGQNLPGNSTRDPSRTLAFTFTVLDDGVSTQVGAIMQLLSNAEGGGRLVVTPSGVVQVSWDFRGWTVAVEIAGQISEFNLGGSGLSIAPGTPGFSVKVGFSKRALDDSPSMIVGSASGTRLQSGSVGLTGTFDFRADHPDVGLELALKKCAVVIAGGDGDGFLAKVLPADGLSTQFDLTIGWSTVHGIYLGGTPGLAVRLPLHKSLVQGVTLDSLKLAVEANGSKLRILAAATGGVSLGPVSAAVQNVGLTASLSFPATGGNLGFTNLHNFGFKFPDGLGVSIDAAAVAGGGFILFDQDKGEYAGFLDISIAEIIQVKFIAILDTKLPDGSKGYSLLFIIFMELPPIQLTFGFTLNGVGGVVGVNRTMSTDGLQAGLHNHTMDYIINPPRTVADAPKVITAVSSFFPAASGRYLFGPILELGWETFVILTVGVLLEVPDPIKLAILGIIDIFLPTIEEPDLALVKIHIDVLGLVDFGTKKISIDGSMYDSRVLEYTLAGDFAFRTSYGPNPNTLLSIGGFNPNFNTTGLDVPQLKRVMISISAGDNPVISASAYLALTSNTIQFGANVEAHASAGSFRVHGYLGFDLLVIIQRPTVSFEFDFVAGFDVSYKGHSLAGINVTGQLTGTTPWHLHGNASFHILCFSVGKSVDFTWGDTLTPAPPPEAVLPDLIPALQDPQNWSAALPDGTTQCATLSVPKANKPTILVHPMGMLSVREKVIPLDFSITRYKGGTPSDGSYFAIGDVHINDTAVSKETFRDYFATGQFIDLSDADKLSRSSFDAYDAGAKIASSNICPGADSARTVTYNEYYIDDPVSPLRGSPAYEMPSDVYDALSHQSAGFGFSLKNTGFNKYRVGPSTPAATIKDPGYVVASVDDLSVRSDIVGAVGVTYYQARAALAAHLAKNPQDAGNLLIVAAHELTL